MLSGLATNPCSTFHAWVCINLLTLYDSLSEFYATFFGFHVFPFAYSELPLCPSDIFLGLFQDIFSDNLASMTDGDCANTLQCSFLSKI